MSGFKEAGINPDAPLDRRPDPPARARDGMASEPRRNREWETAALMQFLDLLGGVARDRPSAVSRAEAKLARLGITVQVEGPQGVPHGCVICLPVTAKGIAEVAAEIDKGAKCGTDRIIVMRDGPTSIFLSAHGKES